MTGLRLAFLGTPAFAVPALQALHRAGHEVVAVYTQPPRPAGRGQSTRPSPVHAEALRLGLAVHTPARLRHDLAAHAAFAAFGLDVAVVAAYGLILPAAMLGAPGRGCLNIHASLLPRWRGAAPIQAAILAGDAASGITIMQMEEGLDSGPMLCAEAVPLTADSTGASLHDTLAPLGARLILDALERQPPPRPQPEAGVTYAPKLSREDGRLDWSQPAAALDRRIRAMHPWPGAFTRLDDQPLKIISAQPGSDLIAAAAPGTVLDRRLSIACGEGALRVTRLQLAGRAPLDADAFLRGYPVAPGQMLG